MAERKRMWEVGVGINNNTLRIRRKVIAKHFEEACVMAEKMRLEADKKQCCPIPEKSEILFVKYAGEVYE